MRFHLPDRSAAEEDNHVRLAGDWCSREGSQKVTPRAAKLSPPSHRRLVTMPTGDHNNVDDKSHHRWENHRSRSYDRKPASRPKDLLLVTTADIMKTSRELEMERQIERLKKQLNDATANVLELQARLHQQKTQSNEALVRMKRRLLEQNGTIRKLRDERDRVMRDIGSSLLLMEGKLKKEQKDIMRVLTEKDTIIKNQQKEIQMLRSEHLCSVAALRNSTSNDRSTQTNHSAGDDSSCQDVRVEDADNESTQTLHSLTIPVQMEQASMVNRCEVSISCKPPNNTIQVSERFSGIVCSAVDNVVRMLCRNQEGEDVSITDTNNKHISVVTLSSDRPMSSLHHRISVIELPHHTVSEDSSETLSNADSGYFSSQEKSSHSEFPSPEHTSESEDFSTLDSGIGGEPPAVTSDVPGTSLNGSSSFAETTNISIEFSGHSKSAAGVEGSCDSSSMIGASSEEFLDSLEETPESDETDEKFASFDYCPVTVTHRPLLKNLHSDPLMYARTAILKNSTSMFAEGRNISSIRVSCTKDQSQSNPVNDRATFLGAGSSADRNVDDDVSGELEANPRILSDEVDLVECGPTLNPKISETYGSYERLTELGLKAATAHSDGEGTPPLRMRSINRLFTNHRSVIRPRDIKHRRLARSQSHSFGDDLTKARYWPTLCL